MPNNDNGGTFILGFLVGGIFGGILGAVVGLLMAPKSGAETRAEIAEQSEVWRLRAEELAARMRESVTPTVETMRERVAPVADRIAALRRQEPTVPESEDETVAPAEPTTVEPTTAKATEATSPGPSA